MKSTEHKLYLTINPVAKFKSLPLWKKISTIVLPVVALLVAFNNKIANNTPTVINGPVAINNSVSRDANSEYTLKANMSIATPYVHVQGLNVKGDMNFDNSNGSSVKQTIISANEDNNSGGNININNSKIGNVNENVVQKNININKSEVDNLNRNIAGTSKK